MYLSLTLTHHLVLFLEIVIKHRLVIVVVATTELLDGRSSAKTCARSFLTSSGPASATTTTTSTASITAHGYTIRYREKLVREDQIGGN